MSSQTAYRSKTDLVADAIRDMVLNRELKPGTELRQREIADKFGVSATPVREALRRLEAEGYVASEPRHAPVVVWPDKPEIYEMALIRGTLEGLGAELAAKRITPSDIEELNGLNARLAAAVDDGEKLAIDREFHLRVCDVSGSPVLVAQLKQVWRPLEGGALESMSSEDWFSDHERIIRALSKGDCSEARDATNHHVLDGFSAYAPTE